MGRAVLHNTIMSIWFGAGGITVLCGQSDASPDIAPNVNAVSEAIGQTCHDTGIAQHCQRKWKCLQQTPTSIFLRSLDLRTLILFSELPLPAVQQMILRRAREIWAALCMYFRI